MRNVQEFTDANFEAEVLNQEQPVLVDFWAAWCGPCRAVAPTIADIAEQYGEAVKVGKLNVDDNPEAANSYGIHAIPAVLLFKDGKVVDKLIGVQPKERYERAIAAAA